MRIDLFPAQHVLKYESLKKDCFFVKGINII